MAPELLVTVRLRKSASSPEYSRNPIVPAGYAVVPEGKDAEFRVAICCWSSETVIVVPDTVVVTVCQVPGASWAGSVTLPTLV